MMRNKERARGLELKRVAPGWYESRRYDLTVLFIDSGSRESSYWTLGRQDCYGDSWRAGYFDSKAEAVMVALAMIDEGDIEEV